MRLIDADALIGKDVGIAWISTEVIRNAPTIDAVPVVRCKDCEYWGRHDNNGDSCTREFDWFGANADDFCSQAKKLKDGD